MRIAIGGVVVADTSDEVVTIQFTDDAERLIVIDNLTRMEPKEGPRYYSQVDKSEELMPSEEVQASHDRNRDALSQEISLKEEKCDD